MKFLIFLSEAMVPLMIFYIVGFGLLSGRPVLDDFIDGAKDGMKTVAGILPTLVGLLVSVGVLRASGFLDFLGELLQMPAALLHIPPQIVPVVLVRLVSNSAATGLVLDIFKEYGTCLLYTSFSSSVMEAHQWDTYQKFLNISKNSHRSP